MSFAGERVVTKGNNGLGCAEDGTNRKSDSDNRSGITRDVALEQMITGSDLSTYWARVGNVPHWFFSEILLEASGEEVVRNVELMIQRDLRDGGGRGKVHTLDRRGSCQTVSKEEESRSQTDSYLYRLMQKKYSEYFWEEDTRDWGWGEKREDRKTLGLIYSAPPSILRWLM